MQPAAYREPDAQREAVTDVAPVQVELGEGVAPVACVTLSLPMTYGGCISIAPCVKQSFD